VGVLAFSTTYARWAAAEDPQLFTEIARGAARVAGHRDNPWRGDRRPA